MKGSVVDEQMSTHREGPLSQIKTKSKQRRLLVKTVNSCRVARMFFVLFLACAVGAILRQASAASAMPTFTQTNLVSDIPGMAKFTDSNLDRKSTRLNSSH